MVAGGRGSPTAGPRTLAGRVGEVDARTWINRFAGELGLDGPDEALFEGLLELAGTAAHASERMAAPLACYLVGRAGVDLATARAAAGRVGNR